METPQSINNAMLDRFKDAKWVNARLDIIVGGVGGIGSWLTFFLSRLGENDIYVFDDDTIEPQNLGGQLYPVSDLGMSKVTSIGNTCREYSGFEIISMPTLYNSNSVTGVMFSAFDNMAARKQMVEAWYGNQMNLRNTGQATPEDINIFIDGRMEAEQGIIYIIDSVSDYKRYMSEMVDDSELPAGPCSFRATTHNAAILAGNMVAVLTNHITNKKMGKKYKTVPYKLTYELPTLTYGIER